MDNETITTADAAEAGKPFDEAYVKKLRDEAAAARVRVKELETAEAARTAAESAANGEIEDLKTRLSGAEARARSLEVADVRTQAAAKHNVPEDLREFITAEDAAGAEAQAEKLAAKLKPASVLPQAGKRNPAQAAESATKANELNRLQRLAQRVPGIAMRNLKG